jgi:hypothetical protein
MSLPSSTFIVRISPETRDGKLIAWHGSVERVGDPQRLYFTSLDSISRFIQESAGFTAQSHGITNRNLWNLIRNAFRKTRQNP